MVRIGKERRRLAEVVAAKLAEPAYQKTLSDRPTGNFQLPLTERVRLPVGGRPLPVPHSDALLLVDPRTGLLRAVDGPTGQVLWSTDVGGQHITGAEVENGRLMLCAREYVKMLDVETGKELWTYSVGGPAAVPGIARPMVDVIVGATFAEGRVAANVGGRQRELVLLDARAGGKVLWKKALHASPMWSPVIWQDRVAVVTTAGAAVYDINTADEVIRLSHQRPSRTPISVGDGRLLLPGFTQLQCIDVAAGKSLWSVPCRMHHAPYHLFDSIARQGADDYVVVCTADRKVVCLDLETGKGVWSKTMADVRKRPVGIRVEGEAVYVPISEQTTGGRQARLRRFDLKTGQEVWTSPSMSGAYPIDFKVGEDFVALLANVWQYKRAGQVRQQSITDSALFCIEKSTGKIAQTLWLKADPETGGRMLPSRIFPVDEMLWVSWADRVLGLRGPN